MLMLLAMLLNEDLTGDGVDESIEIGTKSVIIRDGATGRRYIPIRGESILDFIVFPSTDGSRSYIAVITEKRAAIVGGRAIRVISSIRIPPKEVPSEGIVDHLLTEMPVEFYNLRTIYGEVKYKAVLDEGLTVDASVRFSLANCGGKPCLRELKWGEMPQTVKVEAGKAYIDHRSIEGNSAIFMEFTVEGDPDHDIRVKLDYNGSLKDFGRVRDLFVCIYNPNRRSRSLAFVLDNSYSIFTNKFVEVKILPLTNPYVFR